jgi:ABC-type transport system involved in multi-copper enzyme maturation permease subunit
MKTMMKTNKKLMISAISIVIMAVLVVFFCSPSASVAFAQSQNKGERVVKEMNAFNDNAKNQRLYNLTLNHIAVNMDASASISSTKQLIDFDDNAYTLF